MRFLHGLPGRRAGVRVPGRGRSGGRPRHRDRRGTGRRRRCAAPGAAGVHRGGSRAVRVLHPRAAGRRARPAGPRPGPGRRRRPGGAGRQPVPVHRLREDPGGGPAGRRLAAAGRPTVRRRSSGSDEGHDAVRAQRVSCRHHGRPAGRVRQRLRRREREPDRGRRSGRGARGLRPTPRSSTPPAAWPPPGWSTPTITCTSGRPGAGRSTRRCSAG